LIHESANQIVASRLFGCVDVYRRPYGVGVLRRGPIAGRTHGSPSDGVASVGRDNQQPRINGDAGNNQ